MPEMKSIFRANGWWNRTIYIRPSRFAEIPEFYSFRWNFFNVQNVIKFLTIS